MALSFGGMICQEFDGIGSDGVYLHAKLSSDSMRWYTIYEPLSRQKFQSLRLFPVYFIPCFPQYSLFDDFKCIGNISRLSSSATCQDQFRVTRRLQLTCSQAFNATWRIDSNENQSTLEKTCMETIGLYRTKLPIRL